MPKQVKVSVILTSYNHADYLREAIDSILHQTFSNFELIIVDDASTDHSWEIIKSYSDPRIQAIRSETNTHLGGEIRRAISEIAVGEYIAIHHSDDVWETNKLEVQVAFLEDHPDIGAVFSWAQIINEKGQPFEDEDHYYYRIFEQPNRNRFNWLNHFFYQGNALCHPSVLVRKTCYEDCGVYRYGLAQVTDFDMWIRLCMKYEIHVLPEKLVRFRVRADEANASGVRAETLVRVQFELMPLYENYLSIKSSEEFCLIFPEMRQIALKDTTDLGYAQAMLMLGFKTNRVVQLLGLRFLFKLLNDPVRAATLKNVHGFDNKAFFTLTANHDIFSVKDLMALHDSRIEKENLLIQLDGRNRELSALKSGRIWRFLNRIKKIWKRP